MVGLVPGFVTRQYRGKVFAGSFTGSVLLFDVSGFTPLTEKLSAEGDHGAETLSEILNTLYSPKLYRAVKSSGGFVSGFSGDSFTVILPGDARAFFLASELMLILSETVSRLSAVLSFKAGVSSGLIEWAITEEPARSWYFHGIAMAGACCAVASALPWQVVEKSSQTLLTPTDTRLYELRSSRKTEAAFFPEVLVTGGRKAEFRRVYSVFVSLSRFSGTDIAELVNKLGSSAVNCGGYFCGIHFDEVGPYMLVLLGAPWSFENDGTRAVVFAQSASREYPGLLRVGISAGTVYAGSIGFTERNTYTVMGKQVNTAARIMRHASEPGIFMPENVIKQIPGNVASVEYSILSLRGMTEPVSTGSISSGYLENTIDRFSTELLGREEELGTIRAAAYPLFQSEYAGCIVVSGQAGVGKSHLVYEAGSRLVELDCRMVVLQCSDISNLGFELFQPFLKEFFEQTTSAGVLRNRRKFISRRNSLIQRVHSELADADLASELERTSTFLEGLLNIAEPESFYFRLEAKNRYENTLLSLRSLLTALARLKPLVLIIEDYQWLDSASAETVELLSRSTPDTPLLLILTCRLDDDGSVPELTVNRIVFNAIHLEAMNPVSLPLFIESLAGVPPATELVSFLADRTGSVPLYVEQYVRYLEETNGILNSCGELKLVLKPDLIPGGISDILQARLDRLSGELREMAFTASVLGYEFNTEILGELCPSAYSEKLLESGTICRIWSAASQTTYAFRHSLLRDAAYSMQLRSNLAKAHEKAAATIEKLFHGSEACYTDLAYHYEKAGKKGKSAEYLNKLLDLSRSNYNLRGYLAYSDRLLRILDSSGEKALPDVLSEMHSRISVLTTLSMWDEAIELTDAAEIIADKLKNRKSAGMAIASRAWLTLRRGQLDQAEILVEKAMKIFVSIGDMEGYLRVLGHKGAIFFSKSEFDQAESIFKEKLKLLENTYLPGEKLKCLTNLGCVYKDTGDNQKAEQCFNSALDLATELSSLETMATVLGNRGVLYRNLGRYSEAACDYQRAIEIAENTGDRRALSTQLGGLALIEYDLGHYAEARELYSRQLLISTDLNFTMGIAEAHGYLAACLDEMGEALEALEHYNACISISRSIHLKYYEGIFLILKATMLFDLGRNNEAASANREGLEICSTIGIDEMITASKILSFRMAVSETEELSAIRQQFASMISLIESVESSNEKASVAFMLWKVLTNSADSLKMEFEIGFRREQALELASAAYAINSSMDNARMIEELKTACRIAENSC